MKSLFITDIKCQVIDGAELIEQNIGYPCVDHDGGSYFAMTTSRTIATNMYKNIMIRKHEADDFARNIAAYTSLNIYDMPEMAATHFLLQYNVGIAQSAFDAIEIAYTKMDADTHKNNMLRAQDELKKCEKRLEQVKKSYMSTLYKIAERDNTLQNWIDNSVNVALIKLHNAIDLM